MRLMNAEKLASAIQRRSCVFSQRRAQHAAPVHKLANWQRSAARVFALIMGRTKVIDLEHQVLDFTVAIFVPLCGSMTRCSTLLGTFWGVGRRRKMLIYLEVLFFAIG